MITIRERSVRVTGAKEGFGLMEVMIALGIFAAFMAVIVPRINNWRDRSNKSSTRTTITMVDSAIQDYRQETGQLPTVLKDLIKKPTTDERVAQKWAGPYLSGKDVPKDAWGHKIQYKLTSGGEKQYELYSYGSSKGKTTPKEEWISVSEE